MPPSWLVTWLVRDIDTSTPAGLSEAFREIARLCLADAKKLDECSRGFNSPGEYILIAHALELGLKAFLASRGLPEDELRKRPYGHNLQHLYKAAVDRGLDLSGAVTLGLDPDFVSTIDVTISWINAYHSEGYPGHYALRYDASTRTLPAGNVVFPIIEAILLAVPT